MMNKMEHKTHVIWETLSVDLLPIQHTMGTDQGGVLPDLMGTGKFCGPRASKRADQGCS